LICSVENFALETAEEATNLRETLTAPLMSWTLLALLLAATLVGALTFARRNWPGMLGDEATYLMQHL
jgi:hypothetical protein